MLAFLRVFVFYVGFGALLTWGLFAMGWADALELPGFEGNRTAEATPQTVPIAQVQPKSSLPRETKRSEPEARRIELTTPKMVEPKAVVVTPASPPAPKAVEQPPLVVAGLPPPPMAAPEPPRRQPEALPPAAPGPAAMIETRPTEPVRVAPLPPPPPALPPPARKVENAPALAPPPPPNPPAARAPAASTAARWAPVHRLSGFGADGLADALDDVRRAGDDIRCVAFRDVVFKAGSRSLAPKTNGQLALAAEMIGTGAGQRIEIGSKLGPGRPMASDAKLRTDRAVIVRDQLIALGVRPERLMIDVSESYERVAADVSRANGARAQSIGLCVHG